MSPTEESSALAAARRYFDAWNRRDSRALTATLTDDGTYTDPTTHGPIAGDALASYVTALWQSFPDLAFEIASVHQPTPELVIAEWRMTGTNTGAFHGLPPSGRSVTLPGVDFITVVGDKVRTVTGYFDSQGIPVQLGLQVVIQPDRVGPFLFGTAVTAQTGRTSKPGAFSVTQIIDGTEEEVQDTRTRARDIVREMMTMDGVIGVMTGRIGRRGVTITAWDNAEQPRQLMAGGAHAQAMRNFFARTSGGSAYTSVWIPARINPMWVNCSACGKTSDYEKAAGMCACGAKLPEPGPYW
jgi:steroid delta-isomerase-like uncharacterized protein